MNVDEMLQQTNDAITIRRVYGEAIERDGSLIIPVAKVAGGGGGGSDTEGNGGGGFGVRATQPSASDVPEAEIDTARLVGSSGPLRPGDSVRSRTVRGWRSEPG